jgi:hypothetical protein
MSKYTRHQSVVSRQSDENIEEDHWLKQFQKTLQKGAVQPARQQSLFDQINSIMNGQSKYPSVAAAVEDMKERSGLTAYLDKINKASEVKEAPVAKKAEASDENNVMHKEVKGVPIVMKKCPHIHKALENYIKDTRGNLPVPAIIDKLRSMFQKDVSDAKDWDDDDLIRLVSKLNLMAKRDNPDSFVSNYTNLGRRDVGSDSEIDPSNTDAFFALTPAKV